MTRNAARVWLMWCVSAYSPSTDIIIERFCMAAEQWDCIHV